MTQNEGNRPLAKRKDCVTSKNLRGGGDGRRGEKDKVLLMNSAALKLYISTSKSHKCKLIGKIDEGVLLKHE